MKNPLPATIIRAFLCTLAPAVMIPMTMASPADTTIARWRHDAKGAFTMCFDDSMETQATIGVPELVKRNLVGTWFINPGQERYRTHRTVWEDFAPNNNQELANHTMHHEGAGSLEEADYEIGECARTIWRLRDPGDTRLQAFARGGMTEWDISKKQMRELKKTYHCINRSSELSCKTSDDIHAAEMIKKVNEAIKDKRWVSVHFHGIGDQWLPIGKDDFIELLDYLEANRDQIWSAGWIEAYQYKRERAKAQVTVLENSENGITLNLITGLDPILFTEDLTLITEVPEKWERVTLIQGARSVVLEVRDGRVQYEARPDQSAIFLKPVRAGSRG